ncbi:MAG: AraC family transcriptional regulator [Pseudomonadota bacterium]
MSDLITRAQICDVMTERMNADISEHIGHNWRRVNAMVADQGDATDHPPGFDFFFLELYKSGKHRVRFEGELIHDDKWSGLYVPGHLSFIQRAQPFKIQAEGQGEVHQIFMSPAIFTECAAVLLRGDEDNFEARGFHGVFEPRLKALATFLLEEARRPGLGSDLNADLIAQQMAVLILRQQNSNKWKGMVERVLSDAEMDRVIAYFEDQIEDIGGMDTVAALINMDVYSFTKAFKATTGETPGQFLIQRRLARVKDLLRNSDDSLADITYATGFSNQPHMTATFTKHVGTSPGKWRKAVRA